MRAATLRPRCHGGGIRHPAGEPVTAVRGIPGADRGRHSGQRGAHAQRAGAGGLTSIVQGAHPDRGAGAEKRHQAAAGQPRAAGRRAAVRRGGGAGRVPRAAGGHLGRHGHLPDGGKRQAGTCGRRDPARAAAFHECVGAKDRAAAPDRPRRPRLGLSAGQKHLGLLTKRLRAGHCQPAGRSGRPLLRRAGRADRFLRHRRFAPLHPGGLPHPHPLPRDPDHRRPAPHLAAKPEGLTIFVCILHPDVLYCVVPTKGIRHLRS